MNRFCRARGFTLIELLIVVAIIGILVSIAINNMLLAKIKANIARVQADQNAFKTAHEAYRIDNSQYLDTDKLPMIGNVKLTHDPMESRWVPLTTPISYITTIPWDPFGDKVKISRVVQVKGKWMYKTYDFVSGNEPIGKRNGHPHDSFIVNLRKSRTKPGLEAIPENLLYFFTSQGPDGEVPPFEARLYDPTNGLRSPGDIFKFGP